MKAITTTVYTIDELTDKARQKAIDDWRADDDLPFLKDDMQDALRDLLERHDIKPIDVTVRYSLNYCQGDGASFTGEIEWQGCRATISTNGYGTHYSHYNSVDVTEIYSLADDEDGIALEKVPELDELVHKIGRELEDIGYEYIDAAHDENNIKETMRDNEVYFYANGDIYHEK